MNPNKIIDVDFINDLAHQIHVANVLAGWWPEDADPLTKAQLVLTEIAEATEGARKDLMDDHIPHRKMEEVELADTLIRVLDLGEWAAFKYVGSTSYEDLQDEVIANLDHPAGLHFILSAHAVGFGSLFLKAAGCEFTAQSSFNDESYSRMIDAIIIVANIRQFDLFSALDEKLAYNNQRHDHKLEVRAAEGGKKF